MDVIRDLTAVKNLIKPELKAKKQKQIRDGIRNIIFAYYL